jgi:hypothetical protein
MTREEKLYSMRMVDLKNLADKLEIKINTKAAKEKAIAKILEAEGKLEEPKVEEVNPVTEIKTEVNPVTEVKNEEPKVKEVKEEKKTTRRGRSGKLIEYNGRSLTLNAWAKELGKVPQTLYNRLYNLNWSVEDAFTK